MDIQFLPRQRHDTEETMYGRLGKDPQRAARFSAGLSALITSEGYELHHIFDRTPWASFGSVTVVDLGGSLTETQSLASPSIYA